MSAVPSIVRIGLHFDGCVTTILCQMPHGGLLSERLRHGPELPLIERCQAALAAALRLFTNTDSHAPPELEVTFAASATTQALLYKKLPRVLLLATEGFTDVLRIGRQTTSVPAYDVRDDSREALREDPTEALLEAWSAGGGVEVPERLAADGSVVKALASEALTELRQAVQAANADAIAVMLLHSPRNGQHEQQVAQALAELAQPVLLSSVVLPVYGEFERASATVLAAAGAAAQSAESAALKAALPRPGRVRRVQGDGTTRCDPPPLRGLLADVASGLVGAHKAAAALGVQRCLMLGSGDFLSAAAHCDGTLALTSGAVLAGLPVGIPVVAAALQAVGGESRFVPARQGAPEVSARLDAEEATARLWDAALFTGRAWAPARHTAELDRAAAQQRLTRLGAELRLDAEQAAAAVIAAATAALVDAVWAVSVQRGRDPAELPLFGYGAAAGMLAAEVAAQLGISTVFFPPAAGLMTAYGALAAPVQRERSCQLDLEASGAQQRGTLEAVLRSLTQELTQELEGEGLLPGTSPPGLHWSADLRYAGQSHCLTLQGTSDGGPPQEPADDLVVRFYMEHERRYGFTIGERAVELVRVRMRAGMPASIPVFGQLAQLAQNAESRAPAAADLPPGVILYTAMTSGQVAGPILIYDESAPVFVPAGWTAQRDKQGAIWLRRPPEPSAR